jgi:hypothetical protein
MGGASQAGYPAIGGQLGQPMQPTSTPVSQSPGGMAPVPAPAPTMQPTQTSAQPPSGAMMGGNALSSASAPNQAKNPGATQAKFGGS